MGGILMKKEGYGKPVLIAGIIAGILSATPLLNLLNIVCCLWVVVGGVIGVYLVCRDTEQKVNYGEGAFVGLLSGFVAAVISTALFTVYMLLGFNIAQYMPERIPQFEKFFPQGSNFEFYEFSGEDKYSKCDVPE